MRLAVDITREILGGPTDLQQHLLDVPAFAGMHEDRVLVDAGAEHRRDLLVPQHFFQNRAVQTHQGQAMRGILHQL